MESMRKIGRYTIRGELGQGSMARVFAVWDPQRNEEVALKLLLPQYVKNPQIRRRFLREAAAIKRLNHESIIPIYDFGEDGNDVYYTMQVLRGGTLAERIGKLGRPMDGRQISFILERIAAAVDHVHKRGVIHRDIKPSNIIFNRYGHPYLADFGVIQLSKSRVTQMGSSRFIGTPAYASPEQILSQEIDVRSDLYSLGVVVFEMLTGTIPYESDSWMTTSQMHINDKIPSVQERWGEADRRWQKMINKALAKKPEDRYQSGHEMAEAVRKIVEGKPQTAKSTRLTRPKHERTTSWATIVPALLGILLLLIAGVYFVLNNRQERLAQEPDYGVRVPTVFDDTTISADESPTDDCDSANGYQFTLDEPKLSPRARSQYDPEVDGLPTARFPITNKGCALMADRIELRSQGEEIPIAQLRLEQDEQPILVLEDGESGSLVLVFDVEIARQIKNEWVIAINSEESGGEEILLSREPSVELSVSDWVSLGDENGVIEEDTDVAEDESDEIASNGVVEVDTEEPTSTSTSTSEPEPELPTNTPIVPTEISPPAVATEPPAPPSAVVVEPTVAPTAIPAAPVEATWPAVTSTPTPFNTPRPTQDQTNFEATRTRQVQEWDNLSTVTAAAAESTRAFLTEQTRVAWERSATGTAQAQVNANSATQTHQAQSYSATATRMVQVEQMTRNAQNAQVTQTRQAQVNRVSGSATETRIAQLQQATRNAQNTQATQNARNVQATATQNAWRVQATQTRQAQINRANATATRQAQIQSATRTRQAQSAQPTRPAQQQPTMVIPIFTPTSQTFAPTATPRPPFALIEPRTCVLATNGYMETPFRWTAARPEANQWFAIKVIAPDENIRADGQYVKSNIVLDGRSGNTWAVRGFDTGLLAGAYRWTVVLVENGKTQDYATGVGCLNNLEF